MSPLSDKIYIYVAGFGALLLLGCGLVGSAGPDEGPSERVSRGAARTATAEPFSSELAWAHLRALSDLGPRPSGLAASQAALEYLRTRLASFGLEVQELEIELPAPLRVASAEPSDPARRDVLRHLVARIPGGSHDRVALITHYDTRPGSPGANEGASGAALLLELARRLAERPLPYETELIFLDGEARTSAREPDTPLLLGSRLLADRSWADRADGLRLVVVFRQVADADLAIARDLHSQRAFREEFFASARALGHGEAFPSDRGYVETLSGHRPLWEAGITQVVSIMDPWYGGEQAPGTGWGGLEDTPEHCSPESLRKVGEVTLLALRRITARLEKVDRASGRAARREAEALAPGEAETPPGPAETQESEPSEAESPVQGSEAGAESS